MKKTTSILIILLIMLSGCSAREYHIFQMTNTLQASKQGYHLEQIHVIDGYGKASEPQAFQLGLGGFTTSTR